MKKIDYKDYIEVLKMAEFFKNWKYSTKTQQQLKFEMNARKLEGLLKEHKLSK